MLKLTSGLLWGANVPQGIRISLVGAKLGTAGFRAQGFVLHGGNHSSLITISLDDLIYKKTVAILEECDFSRGIDMFIIQIGLRHSIGYLIGFEFIGALSFMPLFDYVHAPPLPDHE